MKKYFRFSALNIPYISSLETEGFFFDVLVSWLKKQQSNSASTFRSYGQFPKIITCKWASAQVYAAAYFEGLIISTAAMLFCS